MSSSELATQATGWYKDDTSRLGIGRPDSEPLASETVQEMVNMIGELVDGGLAYEAKGDVYYRVNRFKDYGRLSNRQPDEMLEGSRDDLEEGHKEHALDFALWKATKSGEDT